MKPKIIAGLIIAGAVTLAGCIGFLFDCSGWFWFLLVGGFMTLAVLDYDK